MEMEQPDDDAVEPPQLMKRDLAQLMDSSALALASTLDLQYLKDLRDRGVRYYRHGRSTSKWVEIIQRSRVFTYHEPPFFHHEAMEGARFEKCPGGPKLQLQQSSRERQRAEVPLGLTVSAAE